MSQITQIRAGQIQAATSLEGITGLQILPTAQILTTQLQEGPQFLKADGSVVMTGNLTVIAGVTSAHAVAKSQLDAVSSNASTAITTVTAALANETSRATAAETALQNHIDTTNSNLASEISSRTTGDTTNATAINNEATSRQNADNALQSSIDNEQASRIAAVAAANTAISTEANNRAAADTALQTTVNLLLNTKADLAGNAGQVFAVAPPTQDSHAVNKAYVDGIATGLQVKAAVAVATTDPITLAGLQTVDGVALGVGDRVLVKNQADSKANGIYVAQAGAWERATDADNSPGAEFTAGLFVFVEEGTVNAQGGFVCSDANTPGYLIGATPAIELGVAHINFVQFSGAGEIQIGTGLGKNGNTLFIADTGVAAGTYHQVTVNAQGQITSTGNPTTLGAYGITDAANISGSQTQVFAVAAPAASYDAANKTYVDNAITAVNSGLTDGGAALTAETARAVAAETTLQSNINNEATARATAVTAEAARATAAEGVLQGNITAEANSRAGADTTLQTNIDATNTALYNEGITRGNADTTLQNNINATNTALNAESNTRSTAVTTLQGNIDAEAATRATNNTTLTTNLAAETTSRIAGDTLLTTNLNTTNANLAQEVTDRQTAITNVTTAYIAADAVLQTEITNNAASLAANYSTTTAMNAAIQAVVGAAPNALNTLKKIDDALAADESAAAALTTAVSNEVSRAEAAESTLQTNINTVTSNLANEVARATAAEATLATNLGAETTRAEGVEATLNTNIGNETTRAEAAETALQTAITNEINARVAALAALAIASNFNRIVVRDAFSGVQDGTNCDFYLSVPIVPGSEAIYRGLRQYPGVGADYVISGQHIIFTVPPTAAENISIDFIAA